MQIYDIVCGHCNGRTFKFVGGKATCQGCGYVLTDEDIDKLLRQAHEDTVKSNEANEAR